MADKMNDDLFEDVEYNEDLFEDVEYGQESEARDTSSLEALARGGAQGLTMGFADEIAGGLSAVGDVVGSEYEMKDLLDRYRVQRDDSRAENDLAQKEHGAEYLGGEIAGGLLPALGSGGVSAAANLGKLGVKEAIKAGTKSGIKYGAAGGLGVSDADLTEGDIGGAAQDVAIGATLGGAMGGVTPYVGKGLEKVFSPKSTIGEAIEALTPEISKRYKKGKQLAQDGVALFDPELEQKLISEISGTIDEKFIPALKANLKEGAGIKKVLFEDNTVLLKKFDTKKQLSEMKDKLDGIAGSYKDEMTIKGLSNLQGSIDDALENIDVISPFDLDKLRDVFYKQMPKVDPSLRKEASDFSKQFKKLVMNNLPAEAQHNYEVANQVISPTLNAARFLHKDLLTYDKVRGTKAADKVKKYFEKLAKDNEASRDINKTMSHLENELKASLGVSTEGEVGLAGKAILDDMMPKLRELSEQFVSTQEALGGSPLSFGGSRSGQATRLGYLIGKMKGGLKDIKEGFVEGGIESIPGGKAGAKSLKDAGVSIKSKIGDPVQKKVSEISQLSNGSLKQLSEEIREKSPNVANFLSNLSETEGKKKTALLFSATQNPSLRAWIQDMFGDDK